MFVKVVPSKTGLANKIHTFFFVLDRLKYKVMVGQLVGVWGGLYASVVDTFMLRSLVNHAEI